MTTTDRLRALYEKAQSELCPCRGYENSTWLDGVAFQELIALVDAAEVVYERVYDSDDEYLFRSNIRDALAALDAALGGGE